MIETYKDVIGYEGYYKVSNLGNIKSLPRLRKSRYNYISKERILRPHKNKKGYLIVDLHKVKKRETYSVSVLVAIAFLNHKPDGWEIVVDHINNNPSDNRLENLQIITHRQNCTKDNFNSHGSTGVGYNKKTNKFVSTICYDYKTKYLGQFDSAHEAHKAYKKAIKSIETGTPIEVKKAVFSNKHKGVSWSKKRNTWLATVRVKDKVLYLGSSNNEIECYKLVTNFLT